MAKTIKFNLICNERPIRTIEDLQHNFSIEDVLAYFKAGILERWLDVRGFIKEKEQVTKIDKQLDKLKQVSELIKIFNVEIDEQRIDDAIYTLNYEDRKKEDLEQYNTYEFKAKTVVNKYFANYKELVKQIIDEPTNASLIKTNINVIVSDYGEVFEFDYRGLFNKLLNVSPLAILYLLTHKNARRKYLTFPKKDEKQSTDDYIKMFDDNIKIRNTITQLFFKNANYENKKWKFNFAEEVAKEKFGEKIISEKREPSKYFSPICPKNKKVMIICIPETAEVTCEKRSAENQPAFTAKEVNGKFLLFDGLMIATSDNEPIIYMEV